jgi:hypothetical protein
MRLRNITNVAYGIPRMRELNPSQKGAVAEAAITTAAVELGFTVLRPLCEGRRYDLVIDLEPELLRVQCKLGRYLSGVVVVNLSTSRFTPGGYVRTSYTAIEVDAIGVYSPALHRSFLIPIAEVSGGRSVHLRVDPARNNQAEGIKWARDYEFEPVIASLRSTTEKTRAAGGYTLSVGPGL